MSSSLHVPEYHDAERHFFKLNGVVCDEEPEECEQQVQRLRDKASHCDAERKVLLLKTKQLERTVSEHAPHTVVSDIARRFPTTTLMTTKYGTHPYPPLSSGKAAEPQLGVKGGAQLPLMSVQQGVAFYDKRRDDFQDSNNTDVLEAVRAFEKGLCTFTVAERAHGRSPLKDVYHPEPFGLPVFTTFVEMPGKVEALLTTPDFFILSNAQSPFPDHYPTTQKGHAASASLFHLLVIPTRRIYNAVTLSPENRKLLEDMESEAHRFVSFNLNKILTASKLEMIKKLIFFGRQAEVQSQCARFDDVARDFSSETPHLGFFFHVHPDHSVGHLHMHVFPLNDAVRTNREHDGKCCPVASVIVSSSSSSSSTPSYGPPEGVVDSGYVTVRMMIDQETFDLPRNVASMMKTIKNIIDDAGDDQEIPISNVSSHTFARIVDLCKQRLRLQNLESEDDEETRATIQASVDEWTRTFFQNYKLENVKELTQLINAANYLNCTEVFELACKHFASFCILKTPQQVRDMFGIQGDGGFDEDEKKKVEQELAENNPKSRKWKYL